MHHDELRDLALLNARVGKSSNLCLTRSTWQVKGLGFVMCEGWQVMGLVSDWCIVASQVACIRLLHHSKSRDSTFFIHESFIQWRQFKRKHNFIDRLWGLPIHHLVTTYEKYFFRSLFAWTSFKWYDPEWLLATMMNGPSRRRPSFPYSCGEPCLSQY